MLVSCSSSSIVGVRGVRGRVDGVVGVVGVDVDTTDEIDALPPDFSDRMNAAELLRSAASGEGRTNG